jgi:hypothetical protein
LRAIRLSYAISPRLYNASPRCACAIIGFVPTPIESCPVCGETSTVRPKLVLIDEAWVPAPGKDVRLAYFADLRADDVEPENLREGPLEQFIDR